MKKLLIVASLIALPFTSMAASQAAISQRGTCHVFKTENMVPNGWKVVESCDAYSQSSNGQRLDSVNNRRFSLLNWNKKFKKEEVTENSNPLRMGSGKLTRGGADRESAGIIEKKELRTTTERSFGTTKSFLLQDDRRLEKSREEWERRRSARSGISSGSATEMERSGELSNKFWSTEASRRESRLETQNISSKLKKALERRQYLANKGRKAKKVYEYKGPSLRRTYRGDRMEGDLEN